MYDEISSYWTFSSTAAVKDLVVWSRKSDAVSSKKLNLCWFTDTQRRPKCHYCQDPLASESQTNLFCSFLCFAHGSQIYPLIKFLGLLYFTILFLFVHFVTRTVGNLSSVPLCSYNSYCSQAPLQNTIKERFGYFSVSCPVFSIYSAWK